MDRGMRGVAMVLASVGLVGCGESSRAPEGVTLGAATPAGYWEGTVSCSETPMQDHARTLTRKVDAEVWFTVRWDAATRTGVVAGEANAVYDATLTVKNLPKVTAPVPGGNVKFEPEVGGTLTQTDNKRRFPVVGVLSLDPATGRGQLWLAKGVQPDTRSESERNDDTARGVPGPDAPMEFTLRADPGVSGGLSGDAGSIAYDGNTVSGGAGGMDVGADVGGPGGVIIQKIPMAPFTPFTDGAGKVEKRAGGPFVATFSERGAKHAITWTVKQQGGESREMPTISAEMQAQIDALLARARAPAPR